MTTSPETEPFMEVEWDAAVADAGLDADTVHLLPVPGAPVPNGNKAACYPPGLRLEQDELLHGGIILESNSEEVRGKHRVAIFEDVDAHDPIDVAVMAGKLRHELRHVEQRIAGGEALFELEELLNMALQWKAGGLPGSAAFYQFMPTEMDANAASARFLSARHPAAIEDVLRGQDAALARSNTGPGPLADLPAKTVACLFCFREIVEDPVHLPPGVTFESHLATISAAAAKQWHEMAAAAG